MWSSDLHRHAPIRDSKIRHSNDEEKYDDQPSAEFSIISQRSKTSEPTATATSPASTMPKPATSPSRSLRRLQEPLSYRKTMDDPNKRMVWIDLENDRFGLGTESIIEIATIITDSELNIIAEGPNLAISVAEELIEGMDEWNTRHHFGSGLIDRVRNDSVSLEEAERQTLEFIKEHVPKRTAPLCGNSVWNDRQFLVKEMPSVAKYLHYRMVDVSTIKELARRWYPGLPKFEKKGAHLALDDIRESVYELVHFRELIFTDRP